MQESAAKPVSNLDDRDLACTFSPWKFYFLLVFTLIATSVFAFRAFRIVIVMSQHLRLS